MERDRTSWPRKREYLYGLIAAFLAVIYAIVGTMDYQDALIAQQTRFAPQALAVTSADSPPTSPESLPAVHLTHPIPYRAIVCQRSRLQDKLRCVYVAERIK